MLVVDSSVWVDFFNGRQTPQTNLLHILLGKENILISGLIMTEVLQGFRVDRDFNTGLRLLNSLTYVDMTSKVLAIKSAKNYRMLRKQGKTIRKTIDGLIATYCIENRIQMLHSDRDFDVYEEVCGLNVMRA